MWYAVFHMVTVRCAFSSYLPQLCGDDTRIQTLRCLVDPGCLPFTGEDADVFELERSTATRTAKWLSTAGFVTILTIPVLLGAIALLPPSYYGPNGALPIAIICSSVAIIVSNVSSMLFTGTFPDSSSDAANHAQNALSNLQARCDDLAIYALDHQGEVKEIASQFNKSRLIEALKSHTTQTNRVEIVFQRLANVMTYISTGKTSYDSWLERAIRPISSLE